MQKKKVKKINRETKARTETKASFKGKYFSFLVPRSLRDANSVTQSGEPSRSPHAWLSNASHQNDGLLGTKS